MDTHTVISTRDHEHQQAENAVGLRSPNLFAKHPTTGLLMFIFGTLVFAALAINLFSNGPLLAWDRTIANTLPEMGLTSPPIVKIIMNTGFFVGDQVVVVLAIGLCIYFMRKRYWQEFVMLSCGFIGSTLLFLLLSTVIARPRPPLQLWIFEKIPGFPSGHAMAVVVFYLLLAYFLYPKAATTFGRVVLVTTVILIMLYVGFSRIFTGGHYLTDVLAGYAAAIAWSGAFFTLIELYYQKRRNRINNKA